MEYSKDQQDDYDTGLEREAKVYVDDVIKRSLDGIDQLNASKKKEKSFTFGKNAETMNTA